MAWSCRVNAARTLKGVAFAMMALTVGQVESVASDSGDRWLTSQYDARHASERQRYLRELAPMPVGSVYVQRPGEGEDEIRWHFRTMKRLGYSALKQVLLVSGQDSVRVAQIAIEEGLSPWWYGEAGGEPITPELLSRLGLPPDTPVAEARANPRVVDHQRGVYLDRARRFGCESGGEAYGMRRTERTALTQYYVDKTIYRGLPDIADDAFSDWARTTYKTLHAASEAHNRHHPGLGPAYRSWDEVGVAHRTSARKRDYSRVRDELRFRTDQRLRILAGQLAQEQSADPFVPLRRGGETGLFLAMPLRGIDMEGIADLMTELGCFYPSIHLEWHFQLVDHEITRPVYMQASYAHDLFKGGWSFGVETTGGPQQVSGDGQTFTVDDGVMSHLMLSYLAGGFRGFGIWAWSCRTAGLEVGEYALLGRNNEVTPRAKRVGEIGRAARKYRDELWAAHKEPVVGVFTDWDNDAIWATMSARGRDDFAHFGTQARVGVSRALINADVPFEYVTADDLRAGLAPRYEVIYLPAIIGLSEDLQPLLQQYVESGGRLVLDMPGAHMTARGELLPTGRGSWFEGLFGVALRDHQGAAVNRSYSIEGLPVTGFVIDAELTSATAVKHFDQGGLAVSQNAVGDGSAVLVGYEAGRACFRAGSDAAEELLRGFALGERVSPYTCDGAILYRLASPRADHYFLINDGPEAVVHVDTPLSDARWIDVLTGEEVESIARVTVPAFSGRWLRAEKP